jgi:hypothetical protein
MQSVRMTLLVIADRRSRRRAFTTVVPRENKGQRHPVDRIPAAPAEILRGVHARDRRDGNAVKLFRSDDRDQASPAGRFARGDIELEVPSKVKPRRPRPAGRCG